MSQKCRSQRIWSLRSITIFSTQVRRSDTGAARLLLHGVKMPTCVTGRIAVPGRYTTANLLFNLRYPEATNVEYTRFDNIMEGVQSGRYDAGVIIHEGRFVFESYNLVKIIDLGEWWEQETGMPIPLGCIAIRKDKNTILQKHNVESIIRDSVNYAFQNRQASREYVKSHAQEMDDAVIDSHINLYVNEFTLSLGEKGREAVRILKEKTIKKNII